MIISGISTASIGTTGMFGMVSASPIANASTNITPAIPMLIASAPAQ